MTSAQLLDEVPRGLPDGSPCGFIRRGKWKQWSEALRLTPAISGGDSFAQRRLMADRRREGCKWRLARHMINVIHLPRSFRPFDCLGVGGSTLFSESDKNFG